MSTSTLSTVKNGTIVLPKALRKEWKNVEVYISAGKQDIFIKKLARPSLSIMIGEFRTIGKKITRKEVDDAMRAVRARH